MELRKSKIRNQRPLDLIMLLLSLLFLLQFFSATAQTLTLNYQYYRSSTQMASNTLTTTATKSAKSPPLEANRFATRVNQTRRKRMPKQTTMEFLNAHNLVRRRVGEPLFKWNKKLAAYAREWAKKRVNDCRLVHSNGPFGENIFWGGRNHWRPRDVVQIWADEYKHYDVKANTCEPNHMCGHYTQIVWRESTRVGCAREDCSNGGVYVICVYNPPGNYEGENPFGHYKDQTGAVRKDPPASVA